MPTSEPVRHDSHRTASGHQLSVHLLALFALLIVLIYLVWPGAAPGAAHPLGAAVPGSVVAGGDHSSGQTTKRLILTFRPS